MITRKFTLNKNGKVEFTWEELKKLLDEVYLEGQKESEIRFWEPPISYNLSKTSFPNYGYDLIYNTSTTNLTNNASEASLKKEDTLTSGENSNA